MLEAATNPTPRSETPPPIAAPSPGPRRLWAYGAATVAIAALFSWRWPLIGNTDRLYDIGNMHGYPARDFFAYVLGLAALFAIYVLALRETRRMAAARAAAPVFVGGAAAAVAFAFLYPTNAIDVFIYAVRSRLFTEYGANPNAVMPVEFPADRYMEYASREWANDTSPYGPLWNLIAAPATAIGGDDIGLAIAGFKVLAVLALLLGGWAVFDALRATRPEDAATGALFFLWNPLVLWEGIGNAHNDLVLTLCLLGAIWAWCRGRPSLVIPALVVGALIKYVSLLLLPVVAVALFRRLGTWPARGRVAVESALVSGGATLVALYPFYDIGAVRESLSNQGRFFLTSPARLALGVLQDDLGYADAGPAIRLVTLCLLLMALGWRAGTVWERPERLPRAAFEVVLVYLLVAAWTFRTWYVIWPVGLAALVPWGWPAARMIAWSAAALSGYGLFIWIWHWWGVDRETIERMGVLVMFGPVLVVLAAEWGRAIFGGDGQNGQRLSSWVQARRGWRSKKRTASATSSGSR